MKTIAKIILTAFTVLTIASCANTSAIVKLDHFVDDAELKSPDYTSQDWEKSQTEYNLLVEKMLEDDSEYTDEEREMAARAMGRYHALLIKYGIEKSATLFQQLGKLLPQYIDGFASALEENGQNIESFFKNLFDEEKINQSMEHLEQSLESIFGNFEE